MITVKFTDCDGSLEIGYTDRYNTPDATWDVLCNADSGIKRDPETDEYSTTKEEAEWWATYFEQDEKHQEMLRDAELTETEMIHYWDSLHCDMGDQPNAGIEAIKNILKWRE